MKLPFYVVAACVGGLGGLVLGYDIGVITGALESLEDDWGTLDGVTRGFIVAALPLGQAPGALTGGYISDRYGRLRGVFLQCVFYIIGGIILASAPNVEMLLLGRFVVGVGVGVSVSSNVPWMSESCPTNRRGSVTSFYELMVTIGVLLGYIEFYIMKDSESGWRYMFLLSCVLAGTFFFFTPQPPPTTI
jgi:MFS family permease